MFVLRVRFYIILNKHSLRYEKPASENGSRFMALVSRACVMVMTGVEQ